MEHKIPLDGKSLTIEQVIYIAHGKPGEPTVALSADGAWQVKRAAAAVQDLLARGEIAYGITTGFGAFKDRIISLDQVEALQRNIVMSHAVGTGDLFDRVTTRAIMLIRANTLARGHSGIRLSTLQLLLDMLNRGVHPAIPEKGSLGASGDLAPLAHMALVMIGMGKAEYKGEMLPGAEALQRWRLSEGWESCKAGFDSVKGAIDHVHKDFRADISRKYSDIYSRTKSLFEEAEQQLLLTTRSTG